jgi:hypothetical protein
MTSMDGPARRPRSRSGPTSVTRSVSSLPTEVASLPSASPTRTLRIRARQLSMERLWSPAVATGDHRHSSREAGLDASGSVLEHETVSWLNAQQGGSAPAPPVRGLARAAGRARDPLLRGRRAARSRRAGGATGPRRSAPRRRRRQGTRDQTCAARTRQSGAHADRGWGAPTRFGITWRREELNGQPGALFLDREDRLIGVVSLDVAESQIQGVSSIVNPDKLRRLGSLAALQSLLRERS